ncbi:MAG: TIGR01440 family protein [Clostridia bacterium]|nr:TIGR01440 family protein [Clostridia bacterium]
MTYEDIKKQSYEACRELVEIARLKAGNVLVVGCSSSEIMGDRIGKNSNLDAAKAVYEGIMEALKGTGVFLAAQCCEHLNRSVIVEREALLPGAEIVNVVPQAHAGGSFAMTVYNNAKDPVAVELGVIKADAGLDIGDTLIGMQLKAVAVPVRLAVKEIGHGHVVAARTRPKFVGGSRAVYDDVLSGGDIAR